jgi:hypothetical protein
LFTPDAVTKFFDLFEPEMELIKHFPNRLYNCDETGITIVQHKHRTVVGIKGKRQICVFQGVERGCLTTVFTCISPAGHYIPPLIIFPRKNMKMELMKGAPPGSIYACHPSGWIQTDLFTQWFRHFIQHVKPTEEDPSILVLDGHSSHTRNLDVINLGREHHVAVLCLLPHSTHMMQPLVFSFMSSFKTYYAQEIEQWMRRNDGRVVTIYQVAELFGNTYLRAATAESAANGFRKAGLYPCNRNIFWQNDFPFSDATEPSKDIPSLIVDPVRPGTSKEFDPVPVRAADIKPVPPYLSRQEAPAPGLDLLRPSTALPTS